MAPSVTSPTSTSSSNNPEIEVEIIEHGFEGPPGPTTPPPEGQSTSGNIFITDVIPLDGKYVGEKFYKSGTVPENIVLNSITTNSLRLRVKVILIGGFDSYTPKGFVNNTPVTNIIESSTKRYYYGEAEIDLDPEDLTIEARILNSTPKSVSIIRKSDLGPVIYDIYFGTYPGNQSELKEGDQVEIHCICSEDTDTVKILDSPAIFCSGLIVGDINSGGEGRRRASGFATVKNVNGLYEVEAQGYNASSIPGEVQTSGSELKLNQLKPSFVNFEIDYHNLYGAVNQYDEIDILVEAEDFDKVIYTSQVLQIDSPRSYNPAKRAVAIGESSGSVQVTLIRSANNAITTYEIPVIIASADLSARITIATDNPGILIKTPEGHRYSITVIPNQALLQSPKISFNVQENVNLTFNESTGVYTGFITLYESLSFTTLEITDALLTSVTSDTSSNVVLDDIYRVISENAGKLYVPPGQSILEVPFEIDPEYNVLMFGTYKLKLTDTDEYQSLGYCILDDQNNPATLGSKIKLLDPALVNSNTLGLLTVTVTREEVIHG